MTVTQPSDEVERTTVEHADDRAVIAALRRGDEQAFAALIRRYHSSLVRVAMTFVRDRSVAEEVAQETWLGVIRGIERFEGRSSLKTWIFRILTNKAKTRGERERRSVPFSGLARVDDDSDEPAVGPEHFLDSRDPRWQGHWASSPSDWAGIPEDRLLSKETLRCVGGAIDLLPPTQRQVIVLRDVEGWGAEEVCALLALSSENQRVLLHRARSKVRRALELHLAAAA